MWSRNVGEINSSEGFDVKGVGVIIYYREIYRIDFKVGGLKWYFRVNYGNFCNGKKNSYEVSFGG